MRGRQSVGCRRAKLSRDRDLTGLSRTAVILLALAASIMFYGCVGKSEVGDKPADSFDLMELLRAVDPADGSSHVNRGLSVIRKGLRKEAVALVAPVVVRASLRGATGKMMLVGFATPVFNIGDGIQLTLYLEQAGKRRFVGKRYFDAGRRSEDRAWIPLSFPVDIGDADQLEIDVTAGPQGDLVADWLALSSFSLMQREATP